MFKRAFATAGIGLFGFYVTAALKSVLIVVPTALLILSLYLWFQATRRACYSCDKRFQEGDTVLVLQGDNDGKWRCHESCEHCVRRPRFDVTQRNRIVYSEREINAA